VFTIRFSAAEAAFKKQFSDGLLEERLVGVLLQEALGGRHRLAAVEVIFDRLEGRASQHIEVADVTRELRQKSDDELRFHLAHDRWPEGDELLDLNRLNAAEE
jgi:hypothetical protein